MATVGAEARAGARHVRAGAAAHREQRLQLLAWLGMRAEARGCVALDQAARAPVRQAARAYALVRAVVRVAAAASWRQAVQRERAVGPRAGHGQDAGGSQPD